MARVPTRSSFQVLPGGGQTSRVPLTVPQGNVAAEQGMAFGRAVSQVGGDIGERVQEQQFRINKARVRESALEYREALQEAEQEYSQLKGAELVAGDKPVMAEIERRLEQQRSEIMRRLGNEDARYAFEAASAEQLSTYRSRASAYEAEQAEFYINQQRDAAIVAAVETSVTDPTRRAESLQSANASLREKFQEQGYSGDRLEQLTQDALGEFYGPAVANLIASDQAEEALSLVEGIEGRIPASVHATLSTEAREAIDRQRFDAVSLQIAEGTLDEAGLRGMRDVFDDREFETLLGRAQAKQAREEAEQKARQTEWRSRNFARLQVGVDEGSMTAADADLAYERGQISDSQWSQLRRQASAAQSRTASKRGLLDALNAGVPVDPFNTDVKNAADDLWADAGGSALFAQEPERALDVLRSMTGRGIIPGDAASALSGLRLNGNQNQQEFALGMIAELHDENPAAAAAAFRDDSSITEALEYRDMLASGVDASSALNVLGMQRESALQPNNNLMERRQSEAREHLDELGFGTIRGDIGKEMFSWAGFAGLTEPAREDTKQHMRHQYEIAFTARYLQTGDTRKAERYAQRKLSDTWGVSQTSGKRLMAYPPERYYPDVAPEVLEEQVWVDVSALAGEIIDRDRVRLLSTLETGRAVAAGRPPVYAVQIEREDGAIQIYPDFYFDPERLSESNAKAQASAEREASQAVRERTQAANQQRVDALTRPVDVLGHPAAAYLTDEQRAQVEETQRRRQEAADVLRARGGE